MGTEDLEIRIKFTFELPSNNGYVAYRGTIKIVDREGKEKVVGHVTFYHVFVSYSGDETYDVGHHKDEPGHFQFWTLDPISPSGTEIHRAILGECYVEEHGLIDSLVMIDSLEVAKRYRGRGIGTAALQNCLLWARNSLNNLGTHIFLYAVPPEAETPEITEANLERLFRLYERVGFKRLGETQVMALNLEYGFPFERRRRLP